MTTKSNIHIINADIFTVQCDVLAHQVNCLGRMGAGLALQVRNHYPTVYAKYSKACTLPNLLGKIQVINVGNKCIANLFAQYRYGTDRRHTDYDALETCLCKLREYMREHNLKVLAVPYNIGCGLAGGDWNTVYDIINRVFTGDITVYICKK